MARILWGACSQPGSLYPAIPIVTELLHRGHDVTALCDAASEQTFRALGCDFRAASRAGAVTRPPAPMTRADKADWWARDNAALFADAEEALASAAYDVVLADPLETGVGFAAEVAGVPCCSYVHWGLDECGPDVPFCFHLWDRSEPVDEAFARWWNGLRADVGLPPEPRPVAEHRWYRTSPELTLLLGLPDLVHPRGQLPPNVFRVGPASYDPPTSQPTPDWVLALGRSTPAVLASISTVAAEHDTAILRAVAEAVHELGLELVVTVPVAHDVPPLPGRTHIAPFIPHGVLLDRVAIFVNHAGNGSVNRAAYAGVPVLMLPTGRDQFQVAQGATAAGLGLTLQPDERDTWHVRDALQRLLTDPQFASTAKELAAKALGYDAPAAAAELIEARLPA